MINLQRSSKRMVRKGHARWSWISIARKNDARGYLPVSLAGQGIEHDVAYWMEPPSPALHMVRIAQRCHCGPTPPDVVLATLRWIPNDEYARCYHVGGQ
jgi:hypothetical protein